MVVCNVCQSESFVLQDGHYYCVDCHTQAVDWREEEIEEYTQTTRISILSASFEGSKDKRTALKAACAPASWSSWEGLNNILVGQVSEISNLTCMPRNFSFIVLNLWTKYLKVRKIAFNNRTLPYSKKLNQRDQSWVLQKPLEKTSQINRRRYVVKKKDSFIDSSISDVSVHSLKNKLVSQQYLSDTSQEHESTSASGMTSEESDSETEFHGLDDEDWKALCKKWEKKSIGKPLTRKTLIAIIFMACLMSQSELQLCDIMRWLQSNQISFNWVDQYLPGEIQLDKGDAKLFGPVSEPFVFMKTLIINEVMYLNTILDFPPIPNCNVMPLVQRYLQELLLPDSLAALVKKMVDVCQPKLQFRPYAKSFVSLAECRAIAFIVFILKLLYGLNDLSEYQLSNLAEAQENSEDLFVWTQWVELVERRNSILVDNYFWAKQLFNKDAVQTENNAMQPNPAAIAKAQDVFVPSSASFSTRTKSALSSLVNRLAPHIASEDSAAREDPMKSLTFLTEALNLTLAEGSYEHLRADLSKSIARSRNSSCEYMSEEDKFGVETKRYKKKRETEAICPETILYLKFGKQKTVRVRLLKAENDDESPKEPSQQSTKKAEKYRKLMMPSEPSHNSYWVLPVECGMSNSFGEDLLHQYASSSFLWLLKQCAALIDSQPFLIYRELLMIEAKFLLEDTADEGPEEVVPQMMKWKDLY